MISLWKIFGITWLGFASITTLVVFTPMFYHGIIYLPNTQLQPIPEPNPPPIPIRKPEIQRKPITQRKIVPTNRIIRSKPPIKQNTTTPIANSTLDNTPPLLAVTNYNEKTEIYPTALVTGITRGGSTWLYNAVYRMMKTVYGNKVIASGVHSRQKPDFTRAVGHVPIVFKVHDVHVVPGTELATHAFTVRRNARDCLESNVRFFKTPKNQIGALDKRMGYLEQLYSIGRRHPNHVYEMCYKDMVEDPVRVLADVARILFLPEHFHILTTSVIEEIAESLNETNVSSSPENKMLLMNQRHIRSVNDTNQYVSDAMWEKLESRWELFIKRMEGC